MHTAYSRNLKEKKDKKIKTEGKPVLIFLKII